MRVIERGEDLALGEEALVQLVGVLTRAQHLHGDAAPVLAVVALGEVDDAHPAAPELAQHAVRTDPPPARTIREHGGDMDRSRDVQRASFLFVGRQEQLDLASQGRVVATPLLEPGRATFCRHVEGVVENRVDCRAEVRRGRRGVSATP